MDTREIAAGLEDYRNDALFFEARRGELTDTYPDHWIAVHNLEVVEVARDLPELLQRLESAGISVGEAFIEYATTEEGTLILELQ